MLYMLDDFQFCVSELQTPSPNISGLAGASVSSICEQFCTASQQTWNLTSKGYIGNNMETTSIETWWNLDGPWQSLCATHTLVEQECFMPSYLEHSILAPSVCHDLTLSLWCCTPSNERTASSDYAILRVSWNPASHGLLFLFLFNLNCVPLQRKILSQSASLFASFDMVCTVLSIASTMYIR